MPIKLDTRCLQLTADGCVDCDSDVLTGPTFFDKGNVQVL